MGNATDGRAYNELREWSIEPSPYGAAPGKVIVSAGKTIVLCTASIDESVPPWMAGNGKGWVTAEYNMMPGSTSPRKRRDRSGKVDGRTTEIQRLIGRSLRAVVDLDVLGERTVAIDCDVLEADGGTRTASITGGFVAMMAAIRSVDQFADGEATPVREPVAAVSVGIVDGEPTLDLNYQQDFAAAVDMNVVMTGAGRYVEVQGTGEEATFDSAELEAMLQLARLGIEQLLEHQRRSLA